VKFITTLLIADCRLKKNFLYPAGRG